MNEQEERKTKLISYGIIAGLLVTIWYMLDVVLLTFIVTFIFYNLTLRIQNRMLRMAHFRVPTGVVLSIEYVLFLLFTVMFVSEALPIITTWVRSMANFFTTVNLSETYASLNPHVREFLKYLDLPSVIRSLGTWLSTQVAVFSTETFHFFVNLFISLILAFAIILEQPKLKRFGERLNQSQATYIYQYLSKFGQNFCVTFGKVMKVQVSIAVINSFLSMIFLSLMGFPEIAALGFMIFLLGLVPVAGVIVSLIPLSIIALGAGGLKKLAAVILMILILHTVEAYVLNPKLMSNKTRLPVCLTFMILLVGQHYIGVWGLLIGVPIFIFLMNMLEVDYQIEEEKVKSKCK